MQFESKYLGRVDFEKAFCFQKNLWQKVKSENINFLIGLEHPSVITLGRRAEFSENVFGQNQIPVVKATRGGLATLHSEGQLVIYPIVNLTCLNVGVRDYVRLLLQTTQNIFLKLGLKTYQDDQNMGLYTERGKIAFCGLEIKNRVSLHGLSINISNDLVLFENIKSCGVHQLNLDQLNNYRTDIDCKNFYELWVDEFLENQKNIKPSTKV